MTSPHDARRNVTDLRRRLGRQPLSAHQIALQSVIGEPGLSGLILVALATGLGLLLDFQVAHLHPIFSIGMVLISVPASLYWSLRRAQSKVGLMNRNANYMRNLALATVAGQAGCGTVIIVFAALFGGMFLDSRLDTHPIFTVGLVLAAIPISLYAMLRLMLSAIGAITPSSASESDTKENGP